MPLVLVEVTVRVMSSSLGAGVTALDIAERAVRDRLTETLHAIGESPIGVVHVEAVEQVPGE
jgi:hypothetical protein